ncbi:MAG: aminotransferase class I/II-fold pyridoxal phosphate-dependent enzyme [Bacteroidia bacterium]|nr:aminotransferase class I/II-fold pyridoxal phosphate-dependent enzyme [Bacteroidia bacterium]
MELLATLPPGILSLLAFAAFSVFYFGFGYASWKIALATPRFAGEMTRVFPQAPAGKRMHQEVLYSVICLGLFALAAELTLFLGHQQINRLYFDFSAFGWIWFIASIMLAQALQDLYIYLTHRLLHHPWLMKKVHKVHHLSLEASPFAAHSFHPVESLIHALAMVIIPFILPMHPLAVLIFFAYFMAANILGHMGIELFPPWLDHTLFRKLVNSPTQHAMHHAKFRGNYGVYTNIWDLAFGTLLSENPPVKAGKEENSEDVMLQNKADKEVEFPKPHALDPVKVVMQMVDAKGAFPQMRIVSSAPSPQITMDGRNLQMFCTNNYLNLSTHPAVMEAAVESTLEFGSGAGGSRMISGTTSLHVELEKELAALKGGEDCLVFSSGYMANLGAITALANPLAAVARDLPREVLRTLHQKTVIIGDELNHASIIDACKLAKVDYITYRHMDMQDLREKLEKYRANRLIVVTDGIFSMDGTIAPLPQIVALAKEFKAMTMVDDAHATGVIGPNGGGTTDYYGLKGQVDIEIGTLNKALAGVGGFIVASREVCRFLRISSRPYIFSAALPPSVVSALTQAVRLVKSEPELRENLFSNIRAMCHHLRASGLISQTFETPIIPVIIGDETKAAEISKELYELGYFVPAVRWPAVPKGSARLRVTLMSGHTRTQIETFAQTLSRVFRKHGVISSLSNAL